MMTADAMILAAGFGKRMRSHNDSLPKPLVEVGGRPLIDYSLQLLRHSKVEQCVVNLHYKGEMIADYLAKQDGVQVFPSWEEEILETGGGIRKALPQLNSNGFFVLNSDVICLDSTPPALGRLRATWQPEKMDGLLLLIPLEQAVGYEGRGDFYLAADSRLVSRDEGEGQLYVYTGIQLLHPRFLDGSPEGAFGLGVLYRQAISSPECRLYGLVHTGRWFHVGDGEGVHQAERLMTAVA